jgi:hypothetical protein
MGFEVASVVDGGGHYGAVWWMATSDVVVRARWCRLGSWSVSSYSFHVFVVIQIFFPIHFHAIIGCEEIIVLNST